MITTLPTGSVRSGSPCAGLAGLVAGSCLISKDMLKNVFVLRCWSKHLPNHYRHMQYLGRHSAYTGARKQQPSVYFSLRLGSRLSQGPAPTIGQTAEQINITLAASSPPFAFRAFTDSAPLQATALGEKSALGWIGKHTLLLDKDAGSWFFLGEIYTNAPLPVDDAVVEDNCGKCSACMTVCPTDAIISPQRLDARRCISYLTINFI